MYADHQVKPLIDGVGTLFRKVMEAPATGDTVTIPFADLQMLNAQAQALAVLEQRLIVATHSHRFGSTEYMFLAPKCDTFTDTDFANFLGNDYEPNREDEGLSVTQVDALETLHEMRSKARLHQLTATLQQMGYAIVPDGGTPVRWKWTAPSDESLTAFATPREAVEEAWEDAVQQTRAIDSITESDWNGMTFAQQMDRVTAVLEED